MIMVSDLVIGSCEYNTALPTNSRSVVESVFAICQRCHAKVICKNGAYFFTFVRPSVHDGVRLVLGVFANSVACKSTDSMLVN